MICQTILQSRGLYQPRTPITDGLFHNDLDITPCFTFNMSNNFIPCQVAHHQQLHDMNPGDTWHADKNDKLAYSHTSAIEGPIPTNEPFPTIWG